MPDSYLKGEGGFKEMDKQNLQQCIAFEGNKCIASGDLAEVVKKAKEVIDHEGHAAVLIFDDLTAELIEVDFRGTMKEVLKRLEKLPDGSESGRSSSNQDQKILRGPGRPKIGVVSREVTLLPRHWDWLNSQPGGASVALRKLVEEARRVNSNRDKVRHSQEVAYRFMTAMAGDLPGYEEATRALFAGDHGRFNDLVAAWPDDVRVYALKLSDVALGN
jgi:hypothetical protein